MGYLRLTTKAAAAINEHLQLYDDESANTATDSNGERDRM